MRIPARVLAMSAALAIASAIVPAQRVLHVPSQYKTIQAAINAAATSDTVLVAPGRYVENSITFGGKAITVKSSHGPHATIIDGRTSSSDSVFRFTGSETRLSILEGFTITNGYSLLGGGIFCWGSPTIRGNIIVANRGADGGGGICVWGGAPRIENNVISGNSTEQGYRGGGIFVQNGPGTEIVGNVIHANNDMFYPGWGIGILSQPTQTTPVTFVNNTVHGNGNGGMNIDAQRVNIVNSIFWNNGVASVPEIVLEPLGLSPALTFSHSVIRNGKAGIVLWSSSSPNPYTWGAGMLSVDPQFVDAANGDLHLMPLQSPCLDQGDSNAPGLPGTDFEGDPRLVGTTIDIGADEYFPHLYTIGNASPGGTVDVKLIGRSTDPVFWGVSSAIVSPPLALPGLQGVLHLDPAGLWLVPLGPLPATGVTRFSVAFPTSFPRMAIPTQALIGTQLSNLHVVGVW